MLGRNLKYLRESKKLTQEQLAAELNAAYPEGKQFNKGKLSKWENEKEEPRLSSFKLIADYFGVTIDDCLHELLEIRGNRPKVDYGKIPQSEDYQQIQETLSQQYTYMDSAAEVTASKAEEIFKVKNGRTIRFSKEMLKNYPDKKNIFMTRATGDAFNQLIPDQSLIAVHKVADIFDLAENDIVLFRKEKTLLINRFIHDQKNKRLIFRPDSQDPRFTDTILSYQEKETIELYGKVIAYIIEL